jgi:hypothetical protein
MKKKTAKKKTEWTKPLTVYKQGRILIELNRTVERLGRRIETLEKFHAWYESTLAPHLEEMKAEPEPTTPAPGEDEPE